MALNDAMKWRLTFEDVVYFKHTSGLQSNNKITYSNVVRSDIVCYEVYDVVMLHIPHTSNTENVLLPQFVSSLATRPSCCSSIFMQFRHHPLRCAGKLHTLFYVLLTVHLDIFV